MSYDLYVVVNRIQSLERVTSVFTGYMIDSYTYVVLNWYASAIRRARLGHGSHLCEKQASKNIHDRLIGNFEYAMSKTISTVEFLVYAITVEFRFLKLILEFRTSW